MGLQEELKDEETVGVLRELINELGDALPEVPDELKLLKFLKARKYDARSAAEMYRRHLRHVKKVGLEGVKEVTDFVPQKKSFYFATAPLGFDEEGALVRLLCVGSSDLRGLALSHTRVEAARHAAYLLESDKKEQKRRFLETGKGGDDMQVYILDLKGLHWSYLFNRPLAHLFVYLLRMYEVNYPESLKKAYIVNAPGFFSVIYNFVKTIVPSEILSKVDVVNADQTGEVLRRVLDPDLLPASLGGNRMEPEGDPDCNGLFPIPLNTSVPEEYYLDVSLERDPETKRRTVLNQSTFTVEIEVTAPQSVIYWDFQTLDYDIAITLQLRKEGEDEPKCIIPPRRVECHRYIESGRYECEEAGLYELVFDNSYSWWTKKELLYKVKVTKPGEEMKEQLAAAKE